MLEPQPSLCMNLHNYVRGALSQCRWMTVVSTRPIIGQHLVFAWNAAPNNET